jgi:hypothetical protein
MAYKESKSISKGTGNLAHLYLYSRLGFMSWDLEKRIYDAPHGLFWVELFGPIRCDEDIYILGKGITSIQHW